MSSQIQDTAKQGFYKTKDMVMHPIVSIKSFPAGLERNPVMELVCAAIAAVFYYILIVNIIAPLIKNITQAVFAMSKKSSSDSPTEGFIATPEGAYVDPVTGAIKAPTIMTNGMRRKSWAEVQKDINEKGTVSDGTHIGAGYGDGFSSLYENQKAIDAIDKKTMDGVMDLEDLAGISKRIGGAVSNNNHNLYNRGTARPTKMILAKNETRAVIDEKYLPYKDRNQQIAVVGTIIESPGFDVNIERMGEEFDGMHLASVSNHRKIVRTPTAAGAAGGTINMNKEVQLEDSPNASAVANSVKMDGNKLMIAVGENSDGSKKVVSTPTTASSETITSEPPTNYAVGNTIL